MSFLDRAQRMTWRLGWLALALFVVQIGMSVVAGEAGAGDSANTISKRGLIPQEQPQVGEDQSRWVD